MKKERKLKLIVNKVKISNLHTLYGGTNNTTVGSVVLCATNGLTQCTLTELCPDTNLVCDPPPTVTGVTVADRSLLNCIAIPSNGC